MTTLQVATAARVSLGLYGAACDGLVGARSTLRAVAHAARRPRDALDVSNTVGTSPARLARDG